MSAFADISNVSLGEYSIFIDDNCSKTKIPKTQNYILLSEREKKELNIDLFNLISIFQNFYNETKEILTYNFQRWEIQEGNELFIKHKNAIRTTTALLNDIEFIKKYYKNYSSIISKLEQLKKITKDILDILNLYLPRAKQAQEAHRFLQSFIPNNREVLDALA